MQDENKLIGDAIEGVAKGVTKGALETVPIYPDALQPAAKEVGKALQTAMRAVNVALAPIRGLIWSFETAENFIYEKVGKKLEGVPPERIISPSPVIAVPTVQALMLTAGEPTLGELYTNLLATAMDEGTSHDAHPGFVEIIKQMTSDEAKIFRYLGKQTSYPAIRIFVDDADGKGFRQTLNPLFTMIGEDAGCTYVENTDLYVGNLQRLLLIGTGGELFDKRGYERLKNQRIVRELESRVESESDGNFLITNVSLGLTAFGVDFYNACVASKDEPHSSISKTPSRILSFLDY